MEQLKNESSRQYEYMEEMKKWVQKVLKNWKESHTTNHIWLPDE